MKPRTLVLPLLAAIALGSSLTLAAVDRSLNLNQPSGLSALEAATGGPLTENERAQLAIFSKLAQESSLNTQYASAGSNAVSLQATNDSALLFCVQAKAAILMRGQVAGCTTSNGQILLIGGTGFGLSAGMAFSGLIGVYKGPVENLKGRYNLMTLGGAASEFLSKLPSWYPKFVGPEIAWYSGLSGGGEDARRILFLGASVGAMLDLGFGTITIY